MDHLGIAKVLSLVLLSSVKFFFAPGAAIAAGYNIPETILITSLGGTLGVTFFFFVGRAFMKRFDNKRKALNPANSSGKVFSGRNRALVKIKVSFGLLGLVFLTPAILSIPIGCVVAAKFYRNNKLTYPLLLLSTLLWSTGLTIFAAMIKSKFFG